MLEEKDGNLQDPVGKEGLNSENETTQEEQTSQEDPQSEIDHSNAEDAEDVDNASRHSIPDMDYEAMNMENLVGELQRLVKNEKVQAIKKNVDAIKAAFDLKFQDFLEQKKAEFIEGGGNEIDFRYNSVSKRQFNEVYGEYREKKDAYYKTLESNLQNNLKKRLELIERLKGLVNIEEDINDTYKNFKEIQKEWKNAGAIPRTHYNDAWKTYHHHMEIFYDFLNLNRELRDLDFKHNLEEKLKIIQKAEALHTETDIHKAFQELQTLHKIWKEDLGPVDKENREAVWDRFSAATKIIHEKRQEYFKSLEKGFEGNLEKKLEIIAKINAVCEGIATTHKGIQNQMKTVETLRNTFFETGKVPQKQNEKTWKAFKAATKVFNQHKNSFYKHLKNEQQENLDAKKALLDTANELKDSEVTDETTQTFKRIQNEWKTIGHVPRKYSDKIWKSFKAACNTYFTSVNKSKNANNAVEEENLTAKEKVLADLKAYDLGADKGKDLAFIKEQIAVWKNIGRVPFKSKNINNTFNKVLDALFLKLDIDKQAGELLKYGDKLNQLASSDNDYALANEKAFIRKKIEESKNEMRQLENNLEFFSNASEDNPVVKEVVQKINKHKSDIDTWKEKLKKVNILTHKINKEEEEASSKEVAEEDSAD
ncbi:MAG: DUF349 domain-containing protein [Flavobacteriaceae bacterium]